MELTNSSSRACSSQLPAESADVEIIRSYLTQKTIFERFLVCPAITSPYAEDSTQGFFFLNGPKNIQSTPMNVDWWLRGLSDQHIDLGRYFVRGIAHSSLFPRELFQFDLVTEETRPKLFKVLSEMLGVTKSSLASLKISEPEELSFPKLF